MYATPSSTSDSRRLSPGLIVALAALAVPRVVAHDLHLVSPNGFVNALLVFIPPLIWLAVVLRLRPARPFLTVLLIGLCYGIMLAIGHQLLWAAAFGDNPPRLGGAFGRADPLVEDLTVRAAAFISSILPARSSARLSGRSSPRWRRRSGGSASPEREGCW